VDRPVPEFLRVHILPARLPGHAIMFIHNVE
jgi:hypothetical protein